MAKRNAGSKPLFTRKWKMARVDSEDEDDMMGDLSDIEVEEVEEDETFTHPENDAKADDLQKFLEQVNSTPLENFQVNKIYK